MILTPTNELLPEHAKSNLVDPSSGKNNVIEAPVDQKEYGFYPVGKKPNRSYTNWLFRQTYRYLLWLKETFFVEVDNLLEQHQTRIEALEPTVDGHTTQITGLDIRLDTAESTIDNHEARLDIVEPAIVNIANDLATVAGEVDTLQGQVGGFDSRLDILEDISPVTIPAYVPAGEFTVRYDFNLLAWKSSGMTFIHFPSVRKETANNELNILFESFPDILLPPAAAGDPARNVLVPLILHDPYGNYVPGVFEIDVAWGRLRLRTSTSSSPTMSFTNFISSAPFQKGWAHQTVSYKSLVPKA